MHCLSRNKINFYYANYSSKTSLVDSEGMQTGEYRITYTSPALALGNISPISGETQLEIFGNDGDYSRAIVLDKDYGINEQSIIFIDITPTLTNNKYNNNYIVKKVAKSLNFIAIAIKEVN